MPNVAGERRELTPVGAVVLRGPPYGQQLCLVGENWIGHLRLWLHREPVANAGLRADLAAAPSAC